MYRQDVLAPSWEAIATLVSQWRGCGGDRAPATCHPRTPDTMPNQCTCQ